MAKNRGTWSITLTVNTADDLSEADLEHITELIKQGFTSGEICEDEEKLTINKKDTMDENNYLTIAKTKIERNITKLKNEGKDVNEYLTKVKNRLKKLRGIY